MLLFAVSLAATGCQSDLLASDGSTDGAGYEHLTPSAKTRQYIVAEDKPFARQVASHNRTCAKDEACRK